MSAIFLVEWALGWLTVTETMAVEPLPDGVAGDPFWLAILFPTILFLCVGYYEELWTRGYQLVNLAEGLSFAPLRQARRAANRLRADLGSVWRAPRRQPQRHG